MATDLTRGEPSSRSKLRPYRIDVRQYERMIAAGVFAPSTHLELLGGVLVEKGDKVTKNAPHDYVIDMLAELLRRLIGDEWVIRQEKSIRLGQLWRPEPDVAIVRGPRVRYWRDVPTVADLAFLAEVSDSTYDADRGVKYRRYAGAGVPVYWIAHIPAREVEVHSDPTGRAASGGFQQRRIFGRGDEVPVIIDGVDVGRIAVDDLFP